MRVWTNTFDSVVSKTTTRRLGPKKLNTSVDCSAHLSRVFSKTLVGDMAGVDRSTGAAKRRRERRLRSWWRHERCQSQQHWWRPLTTAIWRVGGQQRTTPHGDRRREEPTPFQLVDEEDVGGMRPQTLVERDRHIFDVIVPPVVMNGVQDRILQRLVEPILMDDTEQQIDVPKDLLPRPTSSSCCDTQMAEQLVEVAAGLSVVLCSQCSCPGRSAATSTCWNARSRHHTERCTEQWEDEKNIDEDSTRTRKQHWVCTVSEGRAALG